LFLKVDADFIVRQRLEISILHFHLRVMT